MHRGGPGTNAAFVAAFVFVHVSCYLSLIARDSLDGGELSALHTIIHGSEAAFLRPFDNFEEQERTDQQLPNFIRARDKAQRRRALLRRVLALVEEGLVEASDGLLVPVVLGIELYAAQVGI